VSFEERSVHGIEHHDQGSCGHIRANNEASSNLGEYSKERLMQMVVMEREKCKAEEERRRHVEEELRQLRQRYDEREVAWLNLSTQAPTFRLNTD
jgi:hypothetical protein